MAIRTADVEPPRGKCRFQILIEPVTCSESSHEKNRLWVDQFSTEDVITKCNEFLTEISVTESSHCFLIDFTMHWMDGSKNAATSELRKNVIHTRSWYTGWMSIPKELQLSRTNIEFRVFIAEGAKLDILRLVCVPEPELSSLVETSFYVRDIRCETGLAQKA